MNSNKNKQKQIEYWTKRSEDLYLSGEKEGLEVARQLQKVYKASIEELQNEIYKFYGKYAKDNKIDFAEARKLLDKSELKEFRKQLDEIIKYAKQNNIDATKFKLMRAKLRVSRLEQLKAQMEAELNKLAIETGERVQNYLENVYEDTYYRSTFNVEQDIGFKLDFIKLDKKTIEKAVMQKHNGDNFSSTIWKNKEKLNTILEQAIPLGLALGYNPRKMANIIDKKLGTGYNNTVRILRTEYNYIQNQATAESYKQFGIKQYQIIATLDDRTSEICQEMDGNIYDFSKMEVGINYPPFHPNCRTTTIPYFEDEQLVDRLAKDKGGNYIYVPGDMKYAEYKEKYLN